LGFWYNGGMNEGLAILAYFSPYWTWAVVAAFIVLVGGGCATTWLTTRRIERDDP
jgi:hypothetical protein